MLEEPIYRRIKEEYGFPVYIFDSDRFCENYRLLTGGMSALYAPYRAAYSYKTNYTPRIVSLVRSLGGMAEVVSGMEYALARRVGNAPENISSTARAGRGRELPRCSTAHASSSIMRRNSPRCSARHPLTRNASVIRRCGCMSISAAASPRVSVCAPNRNI